MTKLTFLATVPKLQFHQLKHQAYGIALCICHIEILTILILTIFIKCLTILFEDNYFHILKAYALQNVIERKYVQSD